MVLCGSLSRNTIRLPVQMTIFFQNCIVGTLLSLSGAAVKALSLHLNSCVSLQMAFYLKKKKHKKKIQDFYIKLLPKGSRQAAVSGILKAKEWGL